MKQRIGDTTTNAYAEYEESAIACREGAGETL